MLTNQLLYGTLNPFDADTYNEINYLEIVILPGGTVYKAMPSHQITLLNVASKIYQLSHESIADRCPTEFYADYDTWLMSITGTVSVWYEFTKGKMNPEQARVLLDLKERGLYAGELYSTLNYRRFPDPLARFQPQFTS